MEKTIYFSSLTDKEPQLVSWETVATEIRNGKIQQLCLKYRALYLEHEAAKLAGDKVRMNQIKPLLYKIKQQCPAIMPQAMVEGGRTASHIRAYLPLMIVDIDHIPQERIDAVEQRVKDDEHSLLAYRTISGRGLRVIARVEGSVDNNNFKDAWRSVNEYYRLLTSLDYDPQCANPTRLSGLSFDPTAVYRPLAKPIKMQVSKVRRRRSKGPASTAADAGKVARRLVEGEGVAYAEGSRNDYVSRCIYWMNRFGVKHDDTLQWALAEFEDYDTANHHAVAGIVKSVYHAHADEFHTCRAKAYDTEGAKRCRANLREVEAWLNARHRFRRNMLSHTLEFSDDGKVFAPLDDTVENTLWCDMQRAGINVDMMTLRTLLQSSFIPEFHPLKHYLDHLPPWDGLDHIGRFLGMVHCKDTSAEEFDRYVRRWLVAMVAAALDDGVVNHQIFVLLGQQGTFKTSFMNNILPPELRKYYCIKTNSNRMTKDDALSLTENLLINMEEIDSMQRAEINQLKAMASQTVVTERPAYARNKVRLPHTASFCATGNNLQFLSDDTGNRRWLVFEVEHIDNPWTASIPYSQLYAQVKHLIDTGFRYWFDYEEIDDLNRRNRKFEAPNLARELIVTRYCKPKPLEPSIYVTSSDIVARFGSAVRLNAIQVGKAMQDLGFKQYRTHNGRFWMVKERPASDIGRFVPNMDDISETTDNQKDNEKDLPF